MQGLMVRSFTWNRFPVRNFR